MVLSRGTATEPPAAELGACSPRFVKARNVLRSGGWRVKSDFSSPLPNRKEGLAVIKQAPCLTLTGGRWPRRERRRREGRGEENKKIGRKEIVLVN